MDEGGWGRVKSKKVILRKVWLTLLDLFIILSLLCLQQKKNLGKQEINDFPLVHGDLLLRGKPPTHKESYHPHLNRRAPPVGPNN